MTAGETVVCTFTNTRDQGSVQLKKSWGTGTVGETTLNIGTGTSGAAVSDVATKDLTGANKGNGQTDAKNVDTGTYYFSEVSPGTGYTTSFACTGAARTVPEAKVGGSRTTSTAWP